MEAGLSQRQLCGDVITRNMLSLVEHGSARPSMDTLKLLAARLGKPVSWFLEEETVTSPNQTVMESVRQLYDAGAYSEAVQAMESYRKEDPVFDREAELLRVLLYLHLAERAVGEERFPYALELLNRADADTAYCREELHRRRLLLLGKIPGQRVSERLPSLDEELLLRAEEALDAGLGERAAHLLEAAEDQTGSRWNWIRGRVHMARKEYKAAAACLHRAESAYPKETAPLLEYCYRELEDYKRAYEYAVKQTGRRVTR